MSAPRSRWLFAAALLLCACVAGTVAVVATRGDTPARERWPSAGASKRIAIGATSQFDLASGASLLVRVDPPRGFHGTLRAAVAGLGQKPRRVTAVARITGGGRRSLRLEVPAGRRGALGSCRTRQLSVVLRDRAGHAVARRTRMLAPVPPRCGRFFGARSVWTSPIPADARLDKLSSLLSGKLADEAQREFGAGFTPTINTTRYSAPVYTVPHGQRRVKVTLVGSRTEYGGRLQAILDTGVPIPPDAVPAAGADQHLVVWQPATDTMWELWKAQKDEQGRWTAQWGGRMEDVSGSRGYFYDSSGIQPGATATSLPLVGGLITQADVARGSINHALAMSIPHSRYGVWALPAQRSDGGERSDQAIPEGARFRLDPSLDIDSLELPRLTAMIARAAQRYGIYVRDTSPVITLYAQDPSNLASSPWSGLLEPSAGQILRAFPWEHLQLMPMRLFTYSGRAVPH